MTLANQFPVGLNCQWQRNLEPNISSNLHSWLFDENSLTARLRASSTNFAVKVLGQAVIPCSKQESTVEIIEGQQVLVREVLLYCDQQPHVFARSLLPLTSLTGHEAELANLGEQPLGQVIFNSPNLKRQFIETACFNQDDKITEFVKSMAINVDHNLWGRRSLFTIENKPLLVAEVFLPKAKAYE